MANEMEVCAVASQEHTHAHLHAQRVFDKFLRDGSSIYGHQGNCIKGV